MRSNISAVRAFLLAGLGLAFLSAVQGTQSMVRPKNYKEAPNPLPPVGDLTPHVIHKRATGKVNAAYFTNWGIYGANFQPTDIVPADLTHVLYSFADSSADTGAIVFPTDSYADQEKHFPTDSWNDVGNNLYGCVKQLYLLKLANRNLKVVLSVGGWTYTNTDRHMDFVTDATKRATFVSSAVQLIKDYGFDGIDLDYEFPSNTAQGQGFADLITELRAALTSLMQSNGDSVPYQISAAVSAGSANYAFLVIPQMNAALDYFNLMAYDYSGSFSNITANQANVYGPSLTGFDTDSAVKWYLASGASASKMNLGMPLYGHAFEATAGLGAPYNGIGPGSNNNPGIYAYKDLPLAGATVFENMTDISSYSYDASKQEFVSYDTPDIIKAKVAYAQSKGFAGSMFWELSTDKVGSLSLVGTSHTALGGLDTTQNHINYPDSKWDNIRSNMGATTGTTTTSAATSTSTAPGGTGTGACASVAAWSSTSIYTAGMTATFSGALWTAQWWTQGDTPGGSAGVWVKGAAC